MADVIITLKIMPTNTDVDLEKLKEQSILLIKKFGGEVGKENIQEVAFGLKAIELIFVMEESIGSTDKLEENISKLDGANSVEVTDVRRAIG